MAISGGVNVYPQEAEDALISHPGVLDAAVFGIPDESMRQSVKAVVQPLNPADTGEAFASELTEWLRERIAHYKCPRSTSFEDQLPARTPESSTRTDWSRSTDRIPLRRGNTGRGPS
jgi:long-chain acyl-CoA synthetase